MVGYEGLYGVSDLGNVRSARRRKGSRGGPLRPGLSRAGRLTVVLHKDGKRRTRLVHHLVLEAFTGPRPPGQEARHGPGGALDNRHVNLCWGTPAENYQDKIRDGTDNRGERHGNAKLTEAAVLECRRRYAAGERLRVLVAEFGVTTAGMSNAISGDTWAWLPDAVPVDKRRHGKGGIAHHAAKLTPEIVIEARRRYSAGEKQPDLAAEYGVTQATLQKALTGQTWQDVDGYLDDVHSRRRIRACGRPEGRLTREIVFECRARYMMGEKQAVLAVEFGVSQATMNQAITGRTWAGI